MLLFYTIFLMFLYGTLILALHQCFEVYLVNWKVILVPLSKVKKKTWVMLEMRVKKKKESVCFVLFKKNEPSLILFEAIFLCFCILTSFLKQLLRIVLLL